MCSSACVLSNIVRPAEVLATLLDEGHYIVKFGADDVSAILVANQTVRDRCNVARASSATPSPKTGGDGGDLRPGSPIRHQRLLAPTRMRRTASSYVVLRQLHSSYSVAWMVAGTELGVDRSNLIEVTCEANRASIALVLTLHSDRGAPY